MGRSLTSGDHRPAGFRFFAVLLHPSRISFILRVPRWSWARVICDGGGLPFPGERIWGHPAERTLPLWTLLPNSASSHAHSQTSPPDLARTMCLTIPLDHADIECPKPMLTVVITDPEDPKFDLEKLVESWTKSS